MSDVSELGGPLIGTVHRAGRAIMTHYCRGPQVEAKPDESPVTAADREAEALILTELRDIAPDIPVISEEAASEGRVPDVGDRFFLVDPLDGTKEFINERSDFTVNIGLIENGTPCFGIVYAPARSEVFVTTARSRAAWGRLDPAARGPLPRLDELTPIGTRAPRAEGLTVVMSRSHLNRETEKFLEHLMVAETAQAGSSLKFCLLAQGRADLYPRLARTMEWDTAAGDAVLRAAGGIVLDEAGAPLTYGKRETGFANRGFIAWGRPPDAGSVS